ncbi:myosin regulatory light chain, partial [Cryptosporidium canis]
IANESSVEDVLEIVRQATIAKKEPTIYEIEFGNVSDNSGKCNFESLLKFLHRLGLSPTEAQCEELKREFGTSNINMEKRLVILLQSFGDKMTPEEINGALDKLEIGDEPIDKNEFIEKLCAGSKQIRSPPTVDNKSSKENLDLPCDINPDQPEENCEVN